MLYVPQPDVSWPYQFGPQSGIPFMFMPNIHWLFLEFPKRASPMPTNQHVSCSHCEKVTSPIQSSSPVPGLLKPILSLHWCHQWASVLSVHVPPSSQGAWISVPNRDGEISSFSNSMLPYISQAQKLLSLHFEISQSLVNNLDSSRASPRNSL